METLLPPPPTKMATEDLSVSQAVTLASATIKEEVPSPTSQIEEVTIRRPKVRLDT
jgi:hypothetical protein